MRVSREDAMWQASMKRTQTLESAGAGSQTCGKQYLEASLCVCVCMKTYFSCCCPLLASLCVCPPPAVCCTDAIADCMWADVGTLTSLAERSLTPLWYEKPADDS